MPSPAVRRRRTEVLSSAERADDADELFAVTSARLRRVVAFDAAVWSATDPETGLVTAPMRVENLGGGEHCAAYWESEILGENSVPFRDLARAAVPAARVGHGPGRPWQGENLELRAVLRTGRRPWGVVSLFRFQAPFGAEELEFVAGLSAPLAVRLRSFARRAEARSLPDAPGPGLVLFDPSGEATSINEEARHYLARLPDGPYASTALGVRLPIWIVTAALQARFTPSSVSARVRIRTVDGRWLVCHASSLSGPGGSSGPIVLVIEPAATSDVAVIVAEAYELSPRELEITQLVALGMTTGEIAGRLFISPHTVRDHIKAVFGKVRVSSRGELVARLYAVGLSAVGLSAVGRFAVGQEVVTKPDS
ncbi:LuxR C-terminal-related transcriptional regulator [Nonomuraea sp. NPDC050556]|uniref:LuxR C-terminal-related transcriptional regulator n=1 Tax=Nonomuraea sp. NPDC050556 TaxID=3364369 RepID=UPI0037947B25